MRFLKYILAVHIFSISLTCGIVCADEFSEKVLYVTKQLGCNFPYYLVKMQDSNYFSAEAKIIEPEKIRSYGFQEAQSGDIAVIREIGPQQYRVGVVTKGSMPDNAKMYTVRIEPKVERRTEERVNTENSEKFVSIKGKIENWDIAWPYLRDDTYLQLVEIVPGKGVKSIIVNGRLNLISDLPKTRVADDGSFEFRPEHLQKGIYAFYMQNFQPALGSDPPVYGVLTKGGEYFKLIVNESTTTAVFNCGELAIRQSK